MDYSKNDFINKIIELSTTGQLEEHMEPYSSFTLINKVSSRNLQKDSKKKFSRVISGQNRHIWLDKKLTDRYKDEEKIVDVCKNSKLVITPNKTMTLKASNYWDTYFVSKQMSIKHLKKPDVTVNGIKMSMASNRITTLYDIRCHMGWINLFRKISPKSNRGLLMMYLSVRKTEDPEPIMIRIRGTLIILDKYKVNRILLDKVNIDSNKESENDNLLTNV